MQYAIIGAGGTGGVMGYFMTKAGKDVTLIARGRHLEAMKEHGLTLERLWDPNPETIAVKATDMEHYKEQPDVILVCVKGYSLEDTVPFIRRVAKTDTIVIPILNIYGTGAKLQKELPELLVTDGCIYVSANIKEPGVLLQHGKILRIVFGVRERQTGDRNWNRSGRILRTVLLTEFYPKIFAEKHLKNSPMCLRSEQQDCTVTR